LAILVEAIIIFQRTCTQILEYCSNYTAAGSF